MKEVSNRTILMLLLATIVISLGGTFISLNAINNRLIGIGLEPITGFALAPNATATLTIQALASIKFVDATINFGTGNVISGETNCTLNTVYNNTGACEGWTNETGFTVENDGNQNLTVEILTNKSAADFIGSGGATFHWNVTVNESGSCVNTSGARGIISPNTSPDCLGTGVGDCGTIWENVSVTYKVICPSLRFLDASDSLAIDINVTIPSDAPTGEKLVGITVRGTTEP